MPLRLGLVCEFHEWRILCCVNVADDVNVDGRFSSVAFCCVYVMPCCVVVCRCMFYALLCLVVLCYVASCCVVRCLC